MLEMRHRVVPGGRRLVSGESGVLLFPGGQGIGQAVAED